MLEEIRTSHCWREAVDDRTNAWVRRWMGRFAPLKATFVEHWLEPLAAAAVPAFVHPLTEEERDLLIEEHWRRLVGRPPHGREAFDSIVEALEEGILEACEHSEVGSAFVRTGSRAPTDSPTGREGALQVDGGPEALDVLLESARVFDDLCLAQECGYAPTLVVRPWLEIPPWAEVRATITGRRLTGLAPRHLPPGSPALASHGRDVAVAVRRRCAEVARDWPLDDLVADLVVVDGDALLLDCGLAADADLGAREP